MESYAGFDPNANGRAERAIGILKEKARALMIGASSMPKVLKLWPMAMAHAAYCQLMNSMYPIKYYKFIKFM